MQQLCSRIVLRPICVTFRYLLGLFQAPFLDSSSFWLLSAVADTFGVQWLLLVHVTDKFPCPVLTTSLCTGYQYSEGLGALRPRFDNSFDAFYTIKPPGGPSNLSPAAVSPSWDR